MLSDFQSYYNRLHLIQPQDKILLAISGGMDSVVLADLLHKSKIAFAMAHCNFCLRGDESDGDEEFVKKLSKKYKVTLHSEKFDTETFATKEKLSIQVAARMLRYAWFDKLMNEYGYTSLATAHHQNDMLETVILNLTRGTGISGLHGIRPKQGRIIRPLLFADKDHIRDYVAEKQLGWREDSSNESNKYARNLVRNEVVPILKQLNTNLEETIAQTVEKVSAAEDVFFEKIETLRSEVLDQQANIVNIAFEKLRDLPILFLFELLKPYHFSYEDATSILQSLDEQAGRQFISPTHILVKDRTTLVITAKNLTSFASVEMPDGAGNHIFENLRLDTELIPVKKFKLQSASHIAALDHQKLIFPLKIRKWKEGDWFIPLGMNGKKKLSDFLVDQKIALNIKSDVKVMTSGDSIVWVMGMRIDNRYKVTDKTIDVFKITLFK